MQQIKQVTEIQRKIIALGGGGFSMEPENLALDRYILQQSSKTTPRVCFIPTASGDPPGYIDNFYAAFTTLDCLPWHLSLSHGAPDTMKEFILDPDILYIGGGNTKNMLAVWKEHGVDTIIRQAYEQGTILSGISAGAICWFEEGLTDSIANQLTRLEGLGLLPGSASPHFDGEAERRPIFIEKISVGEMKSGIGIDDGCGVHYGNEKLFKVVASRPHAKAYKFTKAADTVREDTLEAELLS